MKKRTKARLIDTDYAVSYSTYIYRVHKQVHGNNLAISSNAMLVLNNLVNDLYCLLCREMHRVSGSKRHTPRRSFRRKSFVPVTSRAVQTAVRLLFPGDLARHAVSEGTKAVTKYNCSLYEGTEGAGARIMSSTRAGLHFPVGSIHTRLKKRFAHGYHTKVGTGAPVYLAAVLEYIVAEVLHLAGNWAKKNKRKRINPKHIHWAIQQDAELSILFKHVIIPSVGVVPLLLRGSSLT